MDSGPNPNLNPTPNLSHSAKKCPDCGAEIPVDAPAGICIACVLLMAQEEGDPVGSLPEKGAPETIRQLGDYELLREIGRGGMGVVYEARQRSLNRQVALKLIVAGEFASETAVRRFTEEAEVIGRLDHPNIVPIYEVGEFEGHHFYTMKLIAGGSLAARLHKNPRSSRGDEALTSPAQNRPGSKQSLVTSSATPSNSRFTPREVAALLAKIARAVHFVHQRGIIHRDLSPENILLNPDGEPCVTDFGMARLIDRDHRLTQTNAILGKPTTWPQSRLIQGGHNSPPRATSSALEQYSIKCLRASAPLPPRALLQL